MTAQRHQDAAADLDAGDGTTNTHEGTQAAVSDEAVEAYSAAAVRHAKAVGFDVADEEPVDLDTIRAGLEAALPHLGVTPTAARVKAYKRGIAEGRRQAAQAIRAQADEIVSDFPAGQLSAFVQRMVDELHRAARVAEGAEGATKEAS